jgi:NADP-dependent 3-hydroxy acid dehydrogenase YdfG
MAKTWFITGCSSGFGSQFVSQLRAAGHNVIATGRDKTKLAFLQGTGATIMELDVTEPFIEIQRKIQQAWEIYPGGIDVVVNNAGFVMGGITEDVT